MAFDDEDIFRKLIRRFLKDVEEIERLFEKGLEEFSSEKHKGEYFYGFSVTVGPDGKPVIREFGSRPGRKRIIGIEHESQERRPKIREVSEEYSDIDIFENENEITIVAEIKGVDKKNIDVKILKDRETLVIRAPEYFREIKLPSRVNPSRAKARYKHGVLEIVLEKE